jgi:SsrA-binding protein
VSEKIISLNREARHLYELLEFYEAGIVLKGTEVKSLRVQSASLKESFARPKGMEIFLHNLHIAPYEKGNRFNMEPTRTRKLLLHKHEIGRILGKVAQRGFTLVPTKLYFKDGKAKVEIALAKGKKVFDKRRAIKKKDMERELGRVTKDIFKTRF